MKSFGEYLVYVVVKILGALIRCLPVSVVLWVGRRLGSMGYYGNRKHRSLAYANLKIAFAGDKNPRDLKRLVKQVFQNYGQNFVELLRLPLMAKMGIENFVRVEGKDHVHEAIKKGKGVILLAMHFGSWELSSFMGQMLNHPYSVLAKPQKRFSKLDELLNFYRQFGGSTVIARGSGTREVIESLRNNEIIGMVVDQGGKDGSLIKFFGKLASLSVGAIRLGLKFDVPVLFSVIVRENGSRHRLVIHPPLELTKTGKVDEDVTANLNKVAVLMEQYIKTYPAEYMWFYKIWKYSREANIVILSDGKAGHLRQSEAVAELLQEALAGRNIESQVKTIVVQFKNRWARYVANVLSFFMTKNFGHGRIGYLSPFLPRDCFKEIAATSADFVLSTGSGAAAVNFLLAAENQAKNICILKPVISIGLKRFSLGILPFHDYPRPVKGAGLIVTQGAPNLITQEYLEAQSVALAERFPSLRKRGKFRVGVLLGGETKHETLTNAQVRTLLTQIKGVAEQLSAEILVTTSRRTPGAIEQMISREMKGFELCPLVIIANHKNVPQAVGGILGLCDILVVSGDSVSMVSEAASSGKNIIVFRGQKKGNPLFRRDKHGAFLMNLQNQGYIHLTSEQNVGQMILDMAKHKIKTKQLNDRELVLEGLKRII